ncbi:lysyl-tRNA synthetase [Plectosphaerella cucumerina]|uniref:Lysyl-tRNA synthetase n=1 Tax=Plectosphaerella cucumerina TaxID=40658 RepID=A0A8K0TNQ6_9PEZI|nr:lysyl-tRNA synthetase [Plectosphaerella cucumerina]
MTLSHYLRAVRPSIGFVRSPALRQGFHAGPAGAVSRLLRENQPERRPAKASSKSKEDSAYKKMRLRALEELEAKDLFPETHPRLERHEGRTSIAQFKQNHVNIAKEDQQQAQEQQEEDEEPVARAPRTTLYGRVKSLRVHGRILFVTIVNEVETIQGMVNQRILMPQITKEKFKLFCRLIERGDHISLTGFPKRTDRGGLVLEARTLPELLSPAMELIPESLTDPETRAQKRHVDMLVNSEVADTLRLKSYIMQYIRDTFLKDDFLEVQTPILASNAGGAVARPFVTSASEFPSKELSLRIAPELWLKRLVIGGLNKVFEMGPAFRNEGIDATHNPEFTMCEFYSAYTNLDDLIRITESLLRGLAERCNEVIETKKLTSLDRVDVAKFAGPFPQIEFIPELEAALGFRLPNLSGKDAFPELLAVLKLGGIPIPGDSVPASLPKLLDRLAAVYLEPRSFDRPAFITHHPACMSPLAKSFLCPRTRQLVSARAELFVDGRELANMYEEENDPRAQARKLADHRIMSARDNAPEGAEDAVVELDDAARAEAKAVAEAEREAALDEVQRELAQQEEDLDAAPLDQNYVNAMDAALPPTGGWGCGVERLVMLFSGANRISDCLTFGTLRNVVGQSAEGPDAGTPSDQKPADELKEEEDPKKPSA